MIFFNFYASLFSTQYQEDLLTFVHKKAPLIYRLKGLL